MPCVLLLILTGTIMKLACSEQFELWRYGHLYQLSLPRKTPSSRGRDAGEFVFLPKPYLSVDMLMALQVARRG
jgi:hypothetical protein